MEEICEQFPRWRSEIERLYLKDEDFQDMCQDYLEVRGLVAAWAGPPDRHPLTIQGYRTLLLELGTEIVETLLARFPHLEPPPPAMAAQGDGATRAEKGTPGGERQAEPQGQTTPDLTNHGECVEEGGNAIPQTDE